MHLFTFIGFGLSLKLGVSNMIIWHDQQGNYKNLINVKVKQRFRRRSSVGELDTRKVQQRLESSHFTYDNMFWAQLKKKILNDKEQDLKDQMINISNALKLECCRQKN